ncbi:MAG: glycosyltransferase family 9 protein [Nitrospira sp.]|nr:glycosyltransferase family 9 protein [Nitrospira sp.]
MTRSLIILHPGSLGDVLLAVPAIRRLRARFSGRDTLLIARDSVSRFLVACGVINDWMSLEGSATAGLFLKGVLLSRELETWFHRCDLAVAWIDDNEDALRATFQEFGVAQVRIQSPFSLALRARHQSHRFLETVDESIVDESSDRVIQVPSVFVEEGSACLEQIGVPRGRIFVLVHPGSGSVHKCLNPETIAVLIQRLDQKGLVPVVLEGPADQSAIERVLQVSRRRPPTLRNLDLTTLAGVLMLAKFFLGHDSGVTHLAALLGVRTVAVFGPTDPDRWAPLGDHVTILRGPSCLCRSWEAVRQCHEKPCLDLPISQVFTSLEASGLA